MFKQKRNILIMMFALVVIMGIGFAAYSQQLQINDTSSIDSDWNVYIKDVAPGTEDEGTKVGGATGTGAVENKTTAKLNTDLKYPGDYIIYTITVANEGTVDAEIEKVELKAAKKNTVIKYSIIEEANIQYLNVGDEKTFKVKIEYDPTKTGTAKEEEKSNTLTLTVDYVQKGTGSGIYVPGESTFTGVVYSKSEDYIRPGNSIEKIRDYTDDYKTLNSNFFLKHNINNGIVESNEACFIKDSTLYCLKTSEYETNKPLLLNLLGESSCYDGGSFLRCYQGTPSAYADSYGRVLTGDRESSKTCIADNLGAKCGSGAL